MNNTVAEIKNTLEVTNSRITDTEEWVSEQEDGVMEINAEEQGKKEKELRLASETSWTILTEPTYEL